MKKTIKVVAAIIQNKNGDVFIAERGYGFLKGKWEFPGGKVEKGEDDDKALKREIREELDTTLSIGPLFTNVKYDYGDFFLDRNCYLCHILEGRLKRKEEIHLAEAFQPISQLKEEDFCPADALVVAKLKKRK